MMHHHHHHQAIAPQSMSLLPMPPYAVAPQSAVPYAAANPMEYPLTASFSSPLALHPQHQQQQPPQHQMYPMAAAAAPIQQPHHHTTSPVLHPVPPMQLHPPQHLQHHHIMTATPATAAAVAAPIAKSVPQLIPAASAAAAAAEHARLNAAADAHAFDQMVNVLVNGWPQTTNEYLRSVAEQFGTVESVNVHAKGRAFVLFASQDAANLFIANVRRVRMEDPHTRIMHDYTVKAHTSPHRGSAPNRSMHIRNIPSMMQAEMMRVVLEQVVGEVESMGPLVPQPGEDMNSLQITYRDTPPQRAREALSDLRVLPLDNYSDILLATPLVVKYNELACATRERRHAPQKVVDSFAKACATMWAATA